MSVRKSVKHVVERIVDMGDLDSEQEETVRHMIESLVRNRDVLIDKLTVKAQANEKVLTPKMVAGSLKDCIRAHGPITREWTGSAAKRVVTGFISCQDSRAPHLRVMDTYAEAGLSPTEGLTVHDSDPPANIWGYWRDPRWKYVHEYRNSGDHEQARTLAAEVRRDWEVE